MRQLPKKPEQTTEQYIAEADAEFEKIKPKLMHLYERDALTMRARFDAYMRQQFTREEALALAIRAVK